MRPGLLRDRERYVHMLHALLYALGIYTAGAVSVVPKTFKTDKNFGSGPLIVVLCDSFSTVTLP